MRVHHVLAGGPIKDREPPVLRSHQRNCSALILNELRRRKVSRATESLRMNQSRGGAFDRLCQGDLLHLGPALPSSDLCAETEQFVPVRKHDRTIHRGQAGNGSHGGSERILSYMLFRLIGRLPAQVGKFAEGR